MVNQTDVQALNLDWADVWRANNRLAFVEGDDLIFVVRRNPNTFDHFRLEAKVDARIRLFGSVEMDNI